MKTITNSDQIFIFAAVGIGLVAWQIGFNLGAYNTIFFEHLFSVWAASTAIIVACLLLPTERRPMSILGLLALSTPTLWVISLLVSYSYNGSLAWLSFIIGSIALAICLPYIGFVLISILQTSGVAVTSKRYLAGFVVVAVIIGSLGFIVGGSHYYLLTCDDFKLAGHFTPENCWPK